VNPKPYSSLGPRPRSRRRRVGSTALLSFALIAVMLIAAPIGLAYYLMKGDDKVPRPPLHVGSVRMVNYYPENAGWVYFWQRFPTRIINRDFNHAHWLGANTVRVFVHPSVFGYPKPRPQMIDRLEELLQIAQRHHLKLALSLFDGFDRYDDVDGSEQWARALLHNYTDDRRIAYVEVKNEVDPTNRRATSWASHLISDLHSFAPLMPLTISAPGTGGADTLALLKRHVGSDDLAFYSFHYYGGTEWAASELAQAKEITGPSHLLIAETGYASTPENDRATGLPPYRAAQEDWQAHYLSTVAYAARSLGLPPPAPWTLDDFEPGAIPAAMRLSQRVEQYHYGLFRTGGSPKPAAYVVRKAFIHGQVSTDYHEGFEERLDTPNGPLPLGWRLFAPSGATFAWDDHVAHTGRASGRISHSDSSPTMVPAFFTTPVDDSIVPRALYTVSAWARGENATGDTHISIAWYAADHHYVGQTRSAPLPTGTTDWTQLTVSGRAPAGAVCYQIHLKSADNSGTVWFDDVSAG
jgi:hypothetical protein